MFHKPRLNRHHRQQCHPHRRLYLFPELPLNTLLILHLHRCRLRILKHSARLRLPLRLQLKNHRGSESHYWRDLPCLRLRLLYQYLASFDRRAHWLNCLRLLRRLLPH